MDNPNFIDPAMVAKVAQCDHSGACACLPPAPVIQAHASGCSCSGCGVEPMTAMAERLPAFLAKGTSI